MPRCSLLVGSTLTAEVVAFTIIFENETRGVGCRRSARRVREDAHRRRRPAPLWRRCVSLVDGNTCQLVRVIVKHLSMMDEVVDIDIQSP